MPISLVSEFSWKRNRTKPIKKKREKKAIKLDVFQIDSHLTAISRRSASGMAICRTGWCKVAPPQIGPKINPLNVPSRRNPWATPSKNIIFQQRTIKLIFKNTKVPWMRRETHFDRRDVVPTLATGKPMYTKRIPTANIGILSVSPERVWGSQTRSHVKPRMCIVQPKANRQTSLVQRVVEATKM